MSYILEALKKLEQKRQQEGTLNLLTLQGGTAPVRKKRSLWPYAVVGTVLVNGIIVLLLLWFGPWRQPEQLVPVQGPVTQENPSANSEQQGAAQESPSYKVEQQAANNHQDSPATQNNGGQPVKSQPAAPAARTVVPEVSPARSLTSPQASDQERARSETPPPVSKPAPPKGKVLRIQDLPGDLKTSLPALKMTVHSYNEQPQSRFAIINNKTMREGQFLVPQLKVEQITASGVVFSCQGYRFLLGINESP